MPAPRLRLWVLLLVVSLVGFGTALPASPADNSARLYVNGQLLDMPAVEVNGLTYVPLHPLAELLRLDVNVAPSSPAGVAEIRVSRAGTVSGMILPAPALGCLGFGSTAAEMRKVAGQPDSVQSAGDRETWSYGLSRVTLRGNRVVEWVTADKPLGMNIGSPLPNAGLVGLGSTSQQVVDALGTPDAVCTAGSTQAWYYGLSHVVLSDGKVAWWCQVDRDLRTGGSRGLPTITTLARPLPTAPAVAKNGSYYGQISDATGRPKTVHVDGYYRKDGTYVRGHYRSAPRRK